VLNFYLDYSIQNKRHVSKSLNEKWALKSYDFLPYNFLNWFSCFSEGVFLGSFFENFVLRFVVFWVQRVLLHLDSFLESYKRTESIKNCFFIIFCSQYYLPTFILFFVCCCFWCFVVTCGKKKSVTIFSQEIKTTMRRIC